MKGQVGGTDSASHQNSTFSPACCNLLYKVETTLQVLAMRLFLGMSVVFLFTFLLQRQM